MLAYKLWIIIRNIQKNLVGMAYPDGRIDPQGPTLSLLNNSKLNMGKIVASSKIKVQTASSNSSIPDAVIQAAQAAQKKWKVPASITLAQWILESGSGKRMPSHSNNPFGIKATHGQKFVMAPTHEETKDHKRIATMAPFRVFASMDEAFDQHGRLLAQHPAYQLARQNLNNPDAYARALTNHYATDHAYGSLLIAIMKKHSLYKYNQ